MKLQDSFLSNIERRDISMIVNGMKWPQGIEPLIAQTPCLAAKHGAEGHAEGEIHWALHWSRFSDSYDDRIETLDIYRCGSWYVNKCEIGQFEMKNLNPSKFDSERLTIPNGPRQEWAAISDFAREFLKG